MSAAEAFFQPEGAGYRATDLTRGPWARDLMHGGPPAGLLARDLERRAGPDFAVARLSVEFLRPLALATFTISGETIRAGKKVQVLAATLRSEGKDVARANAVCIRRQPIAVPAGEPPSWRPEPPERCEPYAFTFFTEPVGYHTAMELRAARGTWGHGSMAAWMRMRFPLVPGETPTPLVRTVVAADSGNGVGALLDPRRFGFVNPDITVTLFREPEGEWVCLDARTHPGPGGIGLADTRLFDANGPIGRGMQTLVIEGRAAPS